MMNEEKKINSEIEQKNKNVAGEELLSEEELNAVAGGDDDYGGCTFATMVEFDLRRIGERNSADNDKIRGGASSGW